MGSDSILKNNRWKDRENDIVSMRRAGNTFKEIAAKHNIKEQNAKTYYIRGLLREEKYGYDPVWGDLDIGQRKCLMRHGINSLLQARGYTLEQLSSMRGVGPDTILKIKSEF